MNTSNPTTTLAETPSTDGRAVGDSGAAGNGVTGRLPTRARRPGPRELLALHACVVALVAYLILNYFVFLRPGVSWVDHVLAVVVPAAILALCAELWHRMPAGLRASLALGFGALAVVTGLVAAARIRAEGYVAAGVAGVLPLVAGAMLVGLGVWLLWASRKRGGALWWTVVRRALLALLALLVAYWVVLPVSMAIIATERPRDAVEQVDLGRVYEDVSLITRDGVKLSAWYVPPLNKAAIVTFPRAWTVEQARMLVKNGYGVLMVDPRGYGESEGDPNAYGWGSVDDIDAAVAWLRRRDDVGRRRIGGLGLSMGGEQMIEAAARNSGLKAIVSEGAGIRSVHEAFWRRGTSALELALQYPQDLAQTVSVWLLDDEALPPPLPQAAARISPEAVFFIYGEDGQEVEKAVNPAYYDAAFPPKAIWKVPGAGHTGGIEAQPEEYERRVIGFFDRTLLGRP
ncbi:MAG TPA: alpha/beta fold hydrolase [Thermoleophilia bacterium]|nr:alpha/beta fold hydrolase [Thermoleophilia bacterium]